MIGAAAVVVIAGSRARRRRRAGVRIIVVTSLRTGSLHVVLISPLFFLIICDFFRVLVFLELHSFVGVWFVRERLSRGFPRNKELASAVAMDVRF